VIFNFNDNTINEAIHILRSGHLIGLPTETVYGLAADATQDIAVARIFEAKKRPTFNPLIIHGSASNTFAAHVVWNEMAELLANEFWPGPLTLVLPRLHSSSISLLASGGLNTLAIRVPSHPIALEILNTFDGLIAAPSANLSGFMSPTQALHVAESFPELFIVDGGNANIGLESTIIDLSGPIPTLLRPGGITIENIESVIGTIDSHCIGHIRAPGMMKSHYCPMIPIRLNTHQPDENEAYLAFGNTDVTGDHVLNLSPDKNMTEAASNLFKMMRLLDKPNFKAIAVAPIPLCGLGLALNDRLARAAAPRDL